MKYSQVLFRNIGMNQLFTLRRGRLQKVYRKVESREVDGNWVNSLPQNPHDYPKWLWGNTPVYPGGAS